MKKQTLVAGVLVASLMGVGTAAAHGVGPQSPAVPMYPQMGAGQMMMPGTMMSPGMMGPNMMSAGQLMMPGTMMSPGMMGPNMMSAGQMMMPGTMMSPGMMGPNMMSAGQMMMPGMMMGRNMKGPAQMMGPGMMNAGLPPCASGTAAKDLTADDVRSILEGHLKRVGHARLKVGQVTKVEDAYIAEVTTKDDSLVWRLEVDPKTGTMHHVSE